MVLSKLKLYSKMVMFSHSIFSLPFGLLAMFFAAGGIPKLSIFFWILLALLGARNGANAFNRIADRKYDKANPRTKDRHLPSGTVSSKEAYIVVILCFAVFLLSAYMINTLCLILAPFAVILFVFYSYSKRITWLCHYILGFACGGAPVGAYLAVRPEFSLTPFVMAAAVFFWIAGFDIIYATQDIEFDREAKLHSIPARFGLKNALRISTVSHIFSVLFLIALPYFVHELSVIYYIGIAVIAALLTVEHVQVNPDNKKKMEFLSYSINQIVGILFFAFTATDFFL